MKFYLICVAGILMAFVSALASGVRYTYDDDGRLIHVAYTSGARITYHYDPNGNLLTREAQAGGGTYTLVYLAGPHGDIQGVSTQTVAAGQSGTPVTALTNLYYRFAQWSDGSVDNPRTDTNVSASLQVTAQFAPWLAARGSPHWWLAQYGLAEVGLDWDAAELADKDSDGAMAWQEYTADTNPTNATSCLRVLRLEIGPPLTVHFGPSSSNRVYSLWQVNSVADGHWTNVPGQLKRPGLGRSDFMTDTNAPSRERFYRLSVELP